MTVNVESGRKTMADTTLDGHRDCVKGSAPSVKYSHYHLDLNATGLVRCLACLGTVVFHIMFYAAEAHDDGQAMDEGLQQKTWLSVLFNPEPPMQAFMCLTG